MLQFVRRVGRFFRVWWGFRSLAWESSSWNRDNWEVIEDPALV